MNSRNAESCGDLTNTSLALMRSTCACASTAPGWSLRELGAAIMASNPFAASAHAGNPPAIGSALGHGAGPPHADVAMLVYRWNASQVDCRLYIRRATSRMAGSATAQ